MRITVVGCGDAFGSGGRLQTCFHVRSGSHHALIDCGATSVLGLNRLALAPNDVDHIFITHLHGDHFAGLVWWLIHANYVSNRTTPLLVTGPAGTEERFRVVAEGLFPGCTEAPRRFDLRFVAYRDGKPVTCGPWTVLPIEVSHPAGAPSYALRVSDGRKTVGFSGDTEWLDRLCDVARDADLFIAECYGFDRPARYHMHWSILRDNLDRLSARRVLLTHMSDAMLVHRGDVDDARVMVAEDGQIIDV